MELTEKAFEFACEARNAFINGNMQLKKEILLTLGQNYILKDKKLFISPNEWLIPIAEKYPPIEKEYERLELKNHLEATGRNEVFDSLRPLVRGLVDDVRTAFATKNDSTIYIPTLQKVL
jgi:hypothetical protein